MREGGAKSEQPEFNVIKKAALEGIPEKTGVTKAVVFDPCPGSSVFN